MADSIMTSATYQIGPSIFPETAIYNLSNPADIDVTVTPNGTTLSYIKCGTASLTPGTDYTISGNTVTIKKGYLSYCINGYYGQWNYSFVFSDGSTKPFSVTPGGYPSLIPSEATVNTSSMSDVQVKLVLKDFTLSSILNGSTSLTSDNYTQNGDIVTIKKEFYQCYFNDYNNFNQKCNLTFRFSKTTTTNTIVTFNTTFSVTNVPVNLTCTTYTSISASLTWSNLLNSSGISGYQILNQDVVVGETQGTSYVVNGLCPNTAYTFTVKAKYIDGRTVEPSNSVTITTLPDTTAPSAPQNLRANDNLIYGTSIGLLWDVPGDADISTYKIYRDGVEVGTSRDAKFTDTGLTKSTQYKYKVKAVDTDGNISGESNELTVSTNAVDIPDLKVNDISWSPVTPTTGDAITFTADISNEGQAESTSAFNVTFKVDGSIVETVLCNKNIAVGSKTQVATSKKWVATGGNHTISVEVDAANSVNELVEDNNIKSQALVVNSYKVNEGTAFPLGEKQIKTLYRYPDYMSTSMPYNNNSNFGSPTYGNNITTYNLLYYRQGSDYDYSKWNNSIVSHIKKEATNGYYQWVKAGQNSITLQSNVPRNRWAAIWLYANGGTNSNVYVKDLKLIFDDDSKMTIKEAVDNGIISPLCLIYTYYDNRAWQEWDKLYTGGETTSKLAPAGYIVLKCLSKELQGVEFYTNTDWNTYYDGLGVMSYPDMLLSLDPIAGAPTSNISRDSLNAAAANNKVYLIGGHNYLEGGTCNKVEEYDPSTKATTTKAISMPTPRWGAATVSLNNIIYTTGGAQAGCTKAVEAYDPLNGSWSTKANMGTPRQGHGAAVVNGKIYVLGGLDGTKYLDSVEEYDTAAATPAWSPKTVMPTPRAGFATAVVDNKIYVIGGHNNDVQYLDTIDVFDPVNSTWAAISIKMPTPRTGCQAGVIDGKIYVIGGYNGDYLKTVEVYDPVTNSWSTKSSIQTARTDFGCTVCNGKIYVAGGMGAGGYLNTIEEYSGGQ